MQDLRIAGADVSRSVKRVGAGVVVQNPPAGSYEAVIGGAVYPVLPDGRLDGGDDVTPGTAIVRTDSFRLEGSLRLRMPHELGTMEGPAKGGAQFGKVFLQSPNGTEWPGGGFLDASRRLRDPEALSVEASRAFHDTLEYFRSVSGLPADERVVAGKVYLTRDRPLELEMPLVLESGDTFVTSFGV